MITKSEITASRRNGRHARNPYREEIHLSDADDPAAFHLTENDLDRLLFESYEPDRSAGVAFPIALQDQPDAERICAAYRQGGWTVRHNKEEGYLYFSWDQDTEE